MSLLLWATLGLLAGWLAYYYNKTQNSENLVIDMTLGIVGALVGGIIMNLFGELSPDSFNLYGILVAILGAIVIIGLGRTVQSQKI